jgi:hypothetical protein
MALCAMNGREQVQKLLRTTALLDDLIGAGDQ